MLEGGIRMNEWNSCGNEKTSRWIPRMDEDCDKEAEAVSEDGRMDGIMVVVK